MSVEASGTGLPKESALTKQASIEILSQSQEQETGSPCSIQADRAFHVNMLGETQKSPTAEEQLFVSASVAENQRTVFKGVGLNEEHDLLRSNAIKRAVARPRAKSGCGLHRSNAVRSLNRATSVRKASKPSGPSRVETTVEKR